MRKNVAIGHITLGALVIVWSAWKILIKTYIYDFNVRTILYILIILLGITEIIIGLYNLRKK